MKADLVAASDNHALVPVRGDGAVNDIVRGVWLGSAMVCGTRPAVMDKAPKIIVEVVSAHEYERLETGKFSSRDDDFNDSRGDIHAEGDLSGPLAGLSLDGGGVRARAEISFLAPEARQNRTCYQCGGKKGDQFQSNLSGMYYYRQFYQCLITVPLAL